MQRLTPTATPFRPATPVKAGPGKPAHHAAASRDALALSPRARVAVAQQQASEPPAPEFFMAEEVAAAATYALTGRPARIVRSGNDIVPLEVTPSPTGYTVAFGASRFELAVPPGADAAALVTRAVALATMTPASLRGQLTGVAFEGRGATLTTTGPNGPRRLRLVPGPVVGDKASYTVEAPGICFKLSAPTDRDVAPDFAEIVGLLAEQPAALRGSLKTVAIEKGASPVDEYWAQKYQKPGFKAGGTAGTTDITFWKAEPQLDAGMVDHEFGHLVARHFAPDGAYEPADWAAAIAADHTSVSSYGDSNGSEDFAESWRLFSAARSGRPVASGDPGTLAEFEAKFPARARLLVAIASGTRAPLAPVAASCGLDTASPT